MDTFIAIESLGRRRIRSRTLRGGVNQPAGMSLIRRLFSRVQGLTPRDAALFSYIRAHVQLRGLHVQRYKRWPGVGAASGRSCVQETVKNSLSLSHSLFRPRSPSIVCTSLKTLFPFHLLFFSVELFTDEPELACEEIVNRARSTAAVRACPPMLRGHNIRDFFFLIYITTRRRGNDNFR